MRALSPHAKYSIALIHPRTRRGADSTGTIVEYTEGETVSADFDKSGMLDHEIEFALERFNFTGLPEGVNPLTRISVFDSEAYCQRYPEDERLEMQTKIDKRLVELSKQFPSDFIVVEQPASPKPWPSYDDMDVQEILQLQTSTGHNPETIRLYELENKERSEVVDAMLRLEDPDSFAQPEDEEVFVNA
jgi:hypothetical protein